MNTYRVTYGNRSIIIKADDERAAKAQGIVALRIERFKRTHHMVHVDLCYQGEAP